MKTPLFISLKLAIIAFALSTFSTVGHAAGGNYSSNTDLRPIVKLIEQGNYHSAIDQLHDQLDADPDNADIMSLLGFSYRKTRNYEDALTFYEWALRAEPDHRGANEYLGELYLETNQIDKAVQQLQKLDDICRNNCKEYSTLKKAIDSHQQTTASNSWPASNKIS
jgi:tetratricopeptide (TPR) repeat protein